MPVHNICRSWEWSLRKVFVDMVEEKSVHLEKQLNEIWEALETPDSQRESFFHNLFLPMNEQFSQMVQKEEEKYEKMKVEVERIIECCQNIQKKLGKSDHTQNLHSTSLVVKKNELKSLLSELEEELRLKEGKRDSLFSRLLTLLQELELSEEEQKEICSNIETDKQRIREGFLSDVELKSIEENIEILFKLKFERLNELQLITKDIRDLWNEVLSLCFFFDRRTLYVNSSV